MKVDPMLFLQCGMEQSASEASDFSDNEEEIIKTHSPEPLPLINKWVLFNAEVSNFFQTIKVRLFEKKFY